MLDNQAVDNEEEPPGRTLNLPFLVTGCIDPIQGIGASDSGMNSSRNSVHFLHHDKVRLQLPRSSVDGMLKASKKPFRSRRTLGFDGAYWTWYECGEIVKLAESRQHY